MIRSSVLLVSEVAMLLTVFGASSAPSTGDCKCEYEIPCVLAAGVCAGQPDTKLASSLSPQASSRILRLPVQSIVQLQEVFHDDYPELRWRTSNPLLIIAGSLEMLGLDEIDAMERAQRAWRLWRGLDPDEAEVAVTQEDRDRWESQWKNADIVEVLRFAIETTCSDIPGDPRDLANHVWLRRNHLIPDDFLPNGKQWAAELRETTRIALDRLCTVLDLSDEQSHAVRRLHEGLIERQSVIREELSAAFATKRSRLEKELRSEPLFRNDGQREAPRRRDRLRLDAYERSLGSGSLSIACYSGRLLRELLQAHLDTQESALQFFDTDFARLVEQVRGLLTDDQALRLPAALAAYRVCIIAVSPECPPNLTFVRSWADLRAVVTPGIATAQLQTRETRTLHEVLEQHEDALQRLDAGIVQIVKRYEARWVEAHDHKVRELNRIDPMLQLALSLFYPDRMRQVVVGIEYESQGLRETMAARRDIADLLRLLPATEIARKWEDAVDSIVHRNLWSRWATIDLSRTFGAVLSTLDRDSREFGAVADLYAAYQIERDRSLAALVTASLEVAELQCDNVASPEERLDSRLRYRELVRQSTVRKQWYMTQLDLCLLTSDLE